MKPLPALQIPVLKDDWVYKYYYTEEYGFGRAPSRYVRERRIQEVGEWAAQEKPTRALELGCGPAEVSALLSKLHGNKCFVVSLDLNVGFASLARAIMRANGGESRFVVGNATRLPVAAEAFDMLITMEMVEHVPQWRDFLFEAARILKPGGCLIVSTPTRAGFHSWMKRIWQFFTGWEKVNQACLRGEGSDYEKFLSRAEVVEAAEKAGFEFEDAKVRIFVFSFIPPWLLAPNRWAEWLLERIPIVRELGVCRFYKFRRKSGPS